MYYSIVCCYSEQLTQKCNFAILDMSLLSSMYLHILCGILNEGKKPPEKFVTS